jgi:hypothetical protein
MKNDKNEEKRNTFKQKLKKRTPDNWAKLIKRRIEGTQLCAWMASIIGWHYGQGGALEGPLGDIASQVRGENKLTVEDQKAGFTKLGLPWFPAQTDNARRNDEKYRTRHKYS